MTAKIASVAVLLFLVIYSATPSSGRAQAGVQAGGNCSQVIDQIARDHEALQRDARRKGFKFLIDDTVSTASAGLKPILEDSSNPTLFLAGKLQTYKEEFDSWKALCEKYQATFKDIEECAAKPGCSLVDLAKRQNKAIREWLESLTDEGTQATIERVREASSLLQNYNSRLLGTAQGSMSAAVSCMNQYDKLAHQLAEPVDLSKSSPKQPKPKSPPKQPAPKSPPEQLKPKSAGPGVGTAVGVGALVGGGALGGLIIKNAMANKAPDCTSQYTAAMTAMTSMQNATNSLMACGGNSSCYNARMGAVNSAMQPLLSAASGLCTCWGSSVGSQLSASDKAAIQQLWSLLRSDGLNPGALPSCFQ